MKTIDQEKLEGNPGRRPINDLAPEPKKEIPNPPKFLDRIGKRAYHELSRLVGPDGMNVMAKTDGLALAMICDAYQEYRDTLKILDEDGKYYISSQIKIVKVDEKTGKTTTSLKEVRKKHPAVPDMQNAWARVMSGLSKFGMTPYDRKNVKILSPVKKESKKEIAAERRAEAARKAKELQDNAKKGKHIKEAV